VWHNLQELREQDTQLAGTPHLPPQELQERQQQLRQTGGQIKSLFYLATGVINTLATSTTEVAGPFLLPEMVERLAAMLNYFLLYLTGPQRKALKVKGAAAWGSLRRSSSCALLE
jgi:ubiquitin conjugation factor E4 B